MYCEGLQRVDFEFRTYNIYKFVFQNEFLKFPKKFLTFACAHMFNNEKAVVQQKQHNPKNIFRLCISKGCCA